jgi:predicted protein tyrosine phosphatase
MVVERKILFVCTGNIDRSPTAEELFRKVEGLSVKSAGTSEVAKVRLTKQLIDWADEIYVMEFEHLQAVLSMVPNSWMKIEVLDIPDIYVRDQPELKKLILEKMKPYLERRS